MTGDVRTVNIRITVGRKDNMENIKDTLKSIFEFMSYILKFFTLLVISFIISLIIPLSCFQVGILMMIFWFLNLYNPSN